MKEIIEKIEERREEDRIGGGKRSIDEKKGKGKIKERERIEVIIEEGQLEELEMYVKNR